MSKEKPYENRIENFYKKRTVDVMMFGWVNCLENNLPGVSQKQAIENFLSCMGLCEDDYPFESAKVNYSRIKQDFLWSGIKTGSQDKIKESKLRRFIFKLFRL